MEPDERIRICLKTERRTLENELRKLDMEQKVLGYSVDLSWIALRLSEITAGITARIFGLKPEEVGNKMEISGNQVYKTLSECLTMCEATQRRFSHNQNMVEAEPGYEKAWEQERKNCEVLRQLMQRARYGNV